MIKGEDRTVASDPDKVEWAARKVAELLSSLRVDPATGLSTLIYAWTTFARMAVTQASTKEGREINLETMLSMLKHAERDVRAAPMDDESCRKLQEEMMQVAQEKGLPKKEEEKITWH